MAACVLPKGTVPQAPHLGHCTTPQEVCSHFHFVQVHFFQHYPPLLLLCGELSDLLQLNVFVGYNPLIDLTKIATTQSVSEAQVCHAPLFTCAPAHRVENIEVCDAKKWAGSGAEEVPDALQQNHGCQLEA